jgi:2-polyprenyl-3-methyl-5-hydroxy-6-metoxy-1,4-benzoquinol methylase
MTPTRHSLGYFEANPKPSEEELSEYYARKYYQNNQAGYAQAYDTEEVEGIRSNLKVKEALIEQFASPGAVRSMLDIGCGEGFAISYFSERGWDVLGLDFSDHAIKQHNPKYADRFIAGDFRPLLKDLANKGRQFGVLWLDNVLEHVIDPLELLQQCLAVTQPGGLVMIDVPNDFSALQAEARALGTIDRDFWVVLPDHLSYFNDDGLRNLARSAGWEHCRTISDFPIDFNLLHPSANYVADRSVGKAAHRQRIRLTNLFSRISVEKTVALYAALADLGLGRSINAVFRKP